MNDIMNELDGTQSKGKKKDIDGLHYTGMFTQSNFYEFR